MFRYSQANIVDVLGCFLSCLYSGWLDNAICRLVKATTWGVSGVKHTSEIKSKQYHVEFQSLDFV